MLFSRDSIASYLEFSRFLQFHILSSRVLHIESKSVFFRASHFEFERTPMFGLYNLGVSHSGLCNLGVLHSGLCNNGVSHSGLCNLGVLHTFRTLQSWGLTFRTLRSPRRLRRPRYRGARADDARHSPSLPGRPAGTEHRNI